MTDMTDNIKLMPLPDGNVAHLIAAQAAEIEALRAERDALLEALTEIVAAADGDGWKQLDPTFTTARAAIAKATRGTSHRKSE